MRTPVADAGSGHMPLGADFVRRGASSVTPVDLERAVLRAGEIERRFRRGGVLRRLWKDGRLLLSVVRDYRAGRYRALPFGTIAAIVFTLLYVLNPLDVVPDALPVLGQLDDLTVLSAALLLVERDLREYERAVGADPAHVRG